MQDISGFGARVMLTASETFPSGIVITQFADDADPFDTPSIQVKDVGMGLNGDMVVFAKANPVQVTLNVIPASDDDRNLSVLAAANRAAAGRQPAQDQISITVTYPDGSVAQYVRGVITDAIMGKPITSAGRLKSKAYAFKFEDVVS